MCQLKVYSISCSNHDYIFLDLLNTSFSKKIFRFKYGNMWLKEPSFRKEVSEFWLDIYVVQLLPKLINVSSFMAKWGRNFFHKFRDKIKQQKKILVELVDSTEESNIQKYLAERDKLNELLMQEEAYWKQRAKYFCLEEGDENKKFFHVSSTTRKKVNHTNFLETGDGTQVSGHDEMCEMVRDYFTTVFLEQSVGDSNLQSHQDSNLRRVTSDQNKKLVKEVSFEEFTEAINQMHPEKAARSDGLNPTFFQDFWAILGREFFECCKSWLQ